MLRTKNKTEATKFRTLQEHELYAAEAETSAGLQSKLAEQEKLLDDVEELRRNQPGRSVLLDAEAEALLRGTELTPDERLSIDVAQLAHKIEVTERAIKRHDLEMQKVKSIACRELRQERLEAHKAIKLRMQAAAEQLLAAAREEKQFQDTLYQDDVDFGDPLEGIGNPRLFGNWRDCTDDGLLGVWLNEVRQAYQR